MESISVRNYLNTYMTSFKKWLEVTQGSDPTTDTTPTQTNQASMQAAKNITQNPGFAPIQSKMLRLQGSPSAAQKALITGATKLMNKPNIVPANIATQTSVPNVTFAIQNLTGQKLGIPQPKV